MSDDCFSPHLDLDDAFRRSGRQIPLVWARRHANGACNLGDAASAVVVAAISGRSIAQRNFNDPLTRLAAVGTIGQNMYLGRVHLWGTGVDASLRAFGNRRAAFAAAPNTDYVVHATRGPHSRRTLLSAGINAPPIYGDGCWFLPRIIRAEVEKRHELGVVLHLSELDGHTPEALSKHPRHSGGETDGVRVISTLHAPSFQSFTSKVNEILACKRIVSASFHGMLIADAYGIPCLYFGSRMRGPMMLDPESEPELVDHRFADFYSAAERPKLPSYGQPPSEPTDWEAVMKAADALWTPTGHRWSDVFFEAFPFVPHVALSDKDWSLPTAIAEKLPW